MLSCLFCRPQSKEKAAVAGGKVPFFLSKAEKKKRELLAKYEELKSGGGLDKFMEKRRKKNAAKDHRYLPSGRRAGGGAGFE
jgi:ribosomal RNA-processing protein 36